MYEDVRRWGRRRVGWCKRSVVAKAKASYKYYNSVLFFEQEEKGIVMCLRWWCYLQNYKQVSEDGCVEVRVILYYSCIYIIKQAQAEESGEPSDDVRS